jgi:hypothetical protein
MTGQAADDMAALPAFQLREADTSCLRFSKYFLF